MPGSPQPKWLVVTAAYNEAARLPDLVRSLAVQGEGTVARWVLVDDGSTDDTYAVASALDAPFPITVIRRANGGGLAAASELRAFRDGATQGLSQCPEVSWVMKLDADIRLLPGYLEAHRVLGDDVGLAGGLLVGGQERSQRDHVRGGLRSYSRAAWDVVRTLPTALGWDVIDQVAVRQAGLSTVVLPDATAWTSRQTGSSVGLLAGRRRLGVVSRWTGYLPAYLLLKIGRVLLQRPYGLGALAFLRGYLGAGPGPFDASLVAAYREEQAARLRALVRHPVRQARALYGRG